MGYFRTGLSTSSGFLTHQILEVVDHPFFFGVLSESIEYRPRLLFHEMIPPKLHTRKDYSYTLYCVQV